MTLDDLPGPLVNGVVASGIGGGVNVEASAQASVELVNASLLMSKTVGIAGIEPLCTSETTLKVPVNSEVVYCYTVQNTGDVALTNHTLNDDRLGNRIDWPGPDTPAGCILFTFGDGDAGDKHYQLCDLDGNDGRRGCPFPYCARGRGDVSTGGQAVVIISAAGDDEDGDTIPDNIEGTGDLDDDNVPNFRDLDSNGDNRTDRDEVGPDPLNPPDSNGNGIPDYQWERTPTGIDPDAQPEQSRRTFLPQLGH